MIRLLRSTSVRIALIYGVLIILSSLVLVGFVWWRTASYLDREIDAVIAADTRAVGDRLRDFGLPGAVETINDRVKETADEHAVYLLADPMYAPVAGNIAAWPLGVVEKSGWYEVPLVRDSVLHATRILHVVLPTGFHLLVGRDIEDRAAIRALVLNALAWTALAAIVLAIGGGILVRRTVLRRVETINQTARAIVRGDLGRRMPAPDTADEFDQLVRTINGMLDEIQILIEGARRSSDAIAHDLRTPLTELRARLEATAGSMREDARGGEIQSAIEDVDHLIEIFNALLRLADVKSGIRRSGFRQIDLGAILGDVAELYAPLAEANGLVLKVDAAPGLFAHGDPHLLMQALGNLVDNAIKFTPRTGTISLSLRRTGPAQVELSVADTGPGIADTDKARVVRQFERGPGSDKAPGVGLGLSLADAIAGLHGGRLDLTDNPTGGLVAALAVPVDPSS
jgi:hypothetical protein